MVNRPAKIKFNVLLIFIAFYNKKFLKKNTNKVLCQNQERSIAYAVDTVNVS